MNDGDTLHPSDVTTLCAEGEAPAAPTGDWEQRILQLDGRRYSLRLETSFWTALAAIAARFDLRLNRLVAEIAEGRPAGANLASAIRVFCLNDLQRSVLTRSYTADRTSLLTLAENAPSPCLVLGEDQKILTLNDSFLRWVGPPRDRLCGKPVLRHFRFRGARPFEASWTALSRRGAPAEKTRLINIEPGRVLAANALLAPVHGGQGGFLCLVWVLK